jgi:hypothetical protein
MQSHLYDVNINRNIVPMYMTRNVYYSNFESCLMYGIILLEGNNDSKNIFKLQKKVLQIISGVSNVM